MRVVITGGGTGGHLSVAKALLQAFVAQGWECIFIGSSNGADSMYFAEEANFQQKWFLRTQGVVNQKGFCVVKSLWKQVSALRQACKILKDFQPNFVLSVGGYSAAPAAFGACLLRIPLIIHEQNAKIGRLNQLLKPFAKLFFSSYLKSSPIPFYPVNETFFQTARVRSSLQTLLFMGGSQGAKAINSFALSLANTLKNRKIKILHQSGTTDFLRVVQTYLEMGLHVGVLDKTHLLLESKNLQRIPQINTASLKEVDAIVFDFYKDLSSVYALCDFALCRAGASSLWELCANGLPALFVPYPHAANNHQYHNAAFLTQKKLGFLCTEENLSDTILWDCIKRLECDITTISTNLQKECDKTATEQMCHCISNTINPTTYKPL